MALSKEEILATMAATLSTSLSQQQATIESCLRQNQMETQAMLESGLGKLQCTVQEHAQILNSFMSSTTSEFERINTQHAELLQAFNDFRLRRTCRPSSASSTRTRRPRRLTRQSVGDEC